MIAVFLLACFAFCVSTATLFTGFGLGTLLMPAFALIFPVKIAVASTAVVHAANNFFKFILLFGKARREVVIRFGLPAVASSFLGALVLGWIPGYPIYSWTFFGREAPIIPVKAVMGALITLFALIESTKLLDGLQAPARWLPLGGAASGFLGGLSGHQGALRAIFLKPLDLPPPEFASTQAVLALMVDAARLLVYGVFLGSRRDGGAVHWRTVGVVTLAAFAGAYLGKKWLPKVTSGGLKGATACLLFLIGLSLLAGIA